MEDISAGHRRLLINLILLGLMSCCTWLVCCVLYMGCTPSGRANPLPSVSLTLTYAGLSSA